MWDAHTLQDANVLVSCSVDKMCKVWDLRVGQCVSTLQGHGSDINCLAMHPCGEAFATGSHDGSVRMWDLRADQQIEHYCRDVDDDVSMQGIRMFVSHVHVAAVVGVVVAVSTFFVIFFG